jgi:hypothetical protein
VGDPLSHFPTAGEVLANKRVNLANFQPVYKIEG